MNARKDVSEQRPRKAKQAAKPGARSRGFILVIIVGMLAVLVVLGISFAEQGRVDLMGAGNSRDLAATDALAESGFEMAKRILVDDRHVWSSSNSGWNTDNGVGWTSRWGYNPYVDLNTSAGGTVTSPGTGENTTGPAPSRDDPNNFLDAFQLMTWNEEAKGSNAAYAYLFKFDPADNKTHYVQRIPPTEKELMDTWQRQPLARVRKFRVNTGTSFGMIQISITPKDGAINVNDVFQPGTGEEYPGWYETLPAPTSIYSPPGGGLGLSTADAKVNRASPDRRTLEYILGRPCEWSIRQNEDSSDGSGSAGNQFTCMTTDKGIWAPTSMYPSGHASLDNGVYNFRSYFVPWGRSTNQWSLWGESYLTNIGTNRQNTTVFYNQGDLYPNRYNYEAPRYPIWAPTMPFSCRWDKGGLAGLPALDSNAGLMCKSSSADRRWMMPGRVNAQPYPYHLQATSGLGRWDALFMGFGFDKLNPKRGGFNGTADNPHLFWADSAYNSGNNTGAWNDKDGAAYIGAGTYGFVRPHSFQLHFISAAAQGRFWTDLEANWYFGGGPGYGSLQAAFYAGNSTPTLSSYLLPTSAYDSLGMGTNWFPPTAALWNPGAFNNGDLHPQEITRGFTRHPGTMPAAKPAATYTYPISRFDDDIGIANAHFLFNDARTSIRAFGIQENWGLYGNDDAGGRFYDAININVSNYQVIYGLLTPEKLPSMLFRTTVAPHLHWKARMLDAAYKDADKFYRYDPNNPDPQKQPRPYWVRDSLPFPDSTVGNPSHSGIVTYPFGANDATAPWDPTKFKPFHPLPAALGVSPADDPILAPVPEVTLPLPIGADPLATFPQYDAALYSPYIGPSYFKYSIHRAYLNRANMQPLTDPNSVPESQRVVLGKMDYANQEPATWLAQDGVTVTRNGTNRVQDDVFSDTWYDLRLAPPNETGDALNSSALTPPSKTWNWANWFLQRQSVIPTQAVGGERQPINGSNQVKIASQNHSEGLDGDQLSVFAGSRIRKVPALKNYAAPHPLYGLPNPNYLQLFPGTSVSPHWSDQFRRYFPVITAISAADQAKPTFNVPLAQIPTGTLAPMAAWEGSKMIDLFKDDMTQKHGDPDVDRQIHPENPVAKVTDPDSADPWVPNVSKDDAWRITRIGRKYQEIIADEIMDYQMNPWWPNPCVHYRQVAVPLDRAGHETETRKLPGGIADLKGGWWAREENNAKSGITFEVPDYYAYWNRFWMRSAGFYNRTLANCTPLAYSDANNFTENPGTYPQSLQYFGLPITKGLLTNRWRDRILDFPYNTLEDATGCEWRYISGAANLMYEANVPSPMSAAPARNHPFRHWADFVGFLGHLVYRSPLIAGGPKDRIRGVQASAVCPATFFDGSKISDADCLQGMPAVGFDKCIVARHGYWPISGNYGEFPTASGPQRYPDRPANWGDTNEWERRIDEWRGRDASGLRIEQNYISERAANDVLVSMSHGRIRPIDFDGDGHITMTRKQELPGFDRATGNNPYWPGYPWHPLTNADTPGFKTEFQYWPGAPEATAGINGYNSDTTQLSYGLKTDETWHDGNKSDVIQGCVTLPIKFRSNTFRVTVVVELTDAQYKNVYSIRRYARWYSRIPGEPSNGIKVHGPYTGELLQHGTRQMGQVDPEMNFLGTTKP
ncbi:MAG: hypothetical protein KIS92_12280 [Planctomycetota bacterium]|nr:hypothetical protein [Planctomycetota bacterium]